MILVGLICIPALWFKTNKKLLRLFVLESLHLFDVSTKFYSAYDGKFYCYILFSGSLPSILLFSVSRESRSVALGTHNYAMSTHEPAWYPGHVFIKFMKKWHQARDEHVRA